jgi:hypothetical protein
MHFLCRCVETIAMLTLACLNGVRMAAAHGAVDTPPEFSLSGRRTHAMNLKKAFGAFLAVIIAAVIFISKSEALSISDSPTPVFYVGHYCSLTPAVAGSPGAKLTFRLFGKRPFWLQFSATTGAISGKPTQPGLWAHLRLGVWDGHEFASTPVVIKVEPVPGTAPDNPGMPPPAVTAAQHYTVSPTTVSSAATDER